MIRPYELAIDGPLFRKQREWLLHITDRLKRDGESIEEAEGLTNLLDEIADQAHDRHGLDCLLTEDEE